MSNSRSRFAPEQPFRIAALPVTALFAALLVGCGNGADENEAEERAARIAPVGTVVIEGEAPDDVILDDVDHDIVEPEDEDEDDDDEDETDEDDEDDEEALEEDEVTEDEDEAVAEEEDVTAEEDEAAGRTGEEVYQTYCTACHAAGVAGAPVTGDEDGWAERMEKGLESNVDNVISGMGAMPPRGGGSDLTDDEITHAVIYMFNRAGGDY